MGPNSHNAGMKDGAEGNYDPDGYNEKDYDAGYSYGRGQRHGSEDRYDNDHRHSENQEKYDEGWKNAQSNRD